MEKLSSKEKKFVAFALFISAVKISTPQIIEDVHLISQKLGIMDELQSHFNGMKKFSKTFREIQAGKYPNEGWSPEQYGDWIRGEKGADYGKE